MVQKNKHKRKPKRRLKLFIYEGFFPDYTPGLAFAIAYNEADAKRQIIDYLGYDPAEWAEWGTLIVRSLSRRIARAVEGGG